MKQALSFSWDKLLFVILLFLLFFHYFKLIPVKIDEAALIIVSVVATIPVVLSARRGLKNKKISVDLLASIALIASLLAKEWTSAIFINLMLTSARILGDYTESRARRAIQSLLKLRPQKIKVKRDNAILEIPANQVKIGELIIIESGERIPVDGVVVEGEASVDQSSLTGESIPVLKSTGDNVFSSTLNVSGSLIMKAVKIGKDTTLEKIISLVEESQKGKPEIRTRADTFATWYIITMVGGSIIVYAFFRDIYLLLSLLLVACADDIAVAVPMAFLSAIGYAARRGVIIKGGHFLEGLTNVKTIIVDKTGTITKGKLGVQGIKAFGDYEEKDLLRFAAMTEFLSEHPVAKAIMEYVRVKKIEFAKPKNFEEFPGKGTSATYRNKKILSGNLRFFKESGVKITKTALGEINKNQDGGFNVTLIGCDKKLVGFIASADEIRPKAREIVSELKKLGIQKWVMLTGDNERVAERIAREVDISNFHANLLPEDKLKYIKKYLNPQSKTAMIGDGVNDAAALALADIGIAMGAIGSDAAIEAADIALMKDDIREIPEMVELARYTLKIANQDFWIWGVVNVIGLILVFSRFIGPEGASAYNFITDFFPLINSLRLFDLHLKLK